MHARYRGQQVDRDVKGDRTDYATKVDYEAQAAARDVIRRHFPGEAVVGEEDHATRDEVADLVQRGGWLIDPLDGTLEYLHNGPIYSCVVSYVVDAEPVAAACYFGAHDEMYSAAAGQGATLNGGPLRTSGVTKLEDAVVATVYRGTEVERARLFTGRLATLLPHIDAIRITGSPSGGACGVAAGYHDVYAYLSLQSPDGRIGQPWETAAFMLIVREAGGAVASLLGGPPDLLGWNNYAASEELLQAFARVLEASQ